MSRSRSWWTGPAAVELLGRLALGLVLLVGLFELADARRAFLLAVTHNDARPGPGLHFRDRSAGGPVPDRSIGPGDDAGSDLGQRSPTLGSSLGLADRVRIVLIDGAGASTSRTMPTWNALCARGLDLTLDVGFPTVSLPVQVALWSGRSQQASGILFHATGRPLPRPLGADSIPAQVAGSVAIAEAAAYIVHSLGFAEVHPPTADKRLPAGWAGRWLGEAATAFAGPARLAFAHVLGVDTAGHRYGRASPEWQAAAAIADVDLAALVAATPAGARWFVLADHDHLAGGGHGGEERALRIVRACIAGPGIAPGHGGPIHITDLSRAIADSVGAVLPADSSGRPLAAALAAPVGDDDVLPALPRGRVVLALLIVLAGAALTLWATGGRLALQAWWFPIAIVALVVQAQVPTLSTPMIYPPKGLAMAEDFGPGLAVLAVALTLAIRARGRSLRGVLGQLALPAAITLAIALVTGALPLLVGDPVCPVVPRWSGWLSPLMLMLATGLGVAGLVVLVSAALPRSER